MGAQQTLWLGKIIGLRATQTSKQSNKPGRQRFPGVSLPDTWVAEAGPRNQPTGFLMDNRPKSHQSLLFPVPPPSASTARITVWGHMEMTSKVWSDQWSDRVEGLCLRGFLASPCEVGGRPTPTGPSSSCTAEPDRLTKLELKPNSGLSGKQQLSRQALKKVYQCGSPF